MNKYMIKGFVALIILSSSCHDAQKIKSTDNIKLQELQGHIIPITVDLLVPTKILHTHDKLIIYDNIKDNFFKVFSIENFEYLYSWGKLGGAPNEFNFIDDNSLQVYNNTIEILDKFTIKKVSVHDDSLYIFDQVKLNDFQTPLNRLKKIDDETYFADSPIEETSNFEHIIIKPFAANSIQGKFGDYPSDIDLSNNNINRYQTYLKTSTSANAKFAAFYMYFNKLKIYNAKGELKHEIKIDSNNAVSYDPDKKSDNNIYYAEAYATNDFIYALYVGKGKKEIESNLDSFEPQLHVFNWEGEIMAKYNIPFPATSFVIDQDNVNFYAVSFFKLNELFHGKLNLSTTIDYDFKFKTFSNDFYKMNLFENWSHAQVSPESDKNILHDKNGSQVNYNILKDNDGDKSRFANIHLQLIKSGGNIEDYTYKQVSQLKSSKDIIEAEFGDGLISKQKVYIADLKSKSTAADGTESIFLSSHWWWQIAEDQIFQIQLSASEDLFEKYHKVIPSLIETVELKH